MTAPDDIKNILGSNERMSGTLRKKSIILELILNL